MSSTYIVIRAFAVCGPSTPASIEYAFDGQRFKTREEAIKHGFKMLECDDFNVGVIEAGRLVSLDWMDKPVDTDPDVLLDIERSIDL